MKIWRYNFEMSANLINYERKDIKVSEILISGIHELTLGFEN